MSTQRQIPGGPFVNETGTDQRQIPGWAFINENALTYQYAYPISDIAANGWLPSSGSDMFAMLDETTVDHSDYVYSPENPTTEEAEVKVGSTDDPSLSTGHRWDYGLKAEGLDTAFDFEMVIGSTVIDSWTESVTTAEGDVVRTRVLSGAVADDITDYTDVRLRWIARAP